MMKYKKIKYFRDYKIKLTLKITFKIVINKLFK